jgi:hypothetical protein
LIQAVAIHKEACIQQHHRRVGWEQGALPHQGLGYGIAEGCCFAKGGVQPLETSKEKRAM